MIKERMLELLILERIIEQSKPEYTILNFKDKKYDNRKIYDRFAELLEEFLEPYVIESTLKEE